MVDQSRNTGGLSGGDSYGVRYARVPWLNSRLILCRLLGRPVLVVTLLGWVATNLESTYLVTDIYYSLPALVAATLMGCVLER